ncbi:hypothetical protein [Roseivirga pacifica]|uniref:hypothetical protein n=1 Tax=Roseivirga pacifica TaxID=1267423 RepID=UPI003BAC70A2
MVRFISIITLQFLVVYCCGQNDIQQKAFEYIRNHQNTKGYVKQLLSYPNCKVILESDTLIKPMNNDQELLISSLLIRNEPDNVLCSILKEDYGIKESCVRVIGLDYDVAISALDSMRDVYENYHGEELMGFEGADEAKTGFMVYFSDFYKNSLYTEVRYACYDVNDRNRWQGISLAFYFLLNSAGDIKKVYTGTRSYN